MGRSTVTAALGVGQGASARLLHAPTSLPKSPPGAGLPDSGSPMSSTRLQLNESSGSARPAVRPTFETSRHRQVHRQLAR